MPDVTVPAGIFKSIGLAGWSFIKKPKENYYICKNAIKGLWRYYIDRDKEYNFVINKRLSHHTIYPDGTLITFTKYSIFMLDDGHFKIKKSYKSENNELNEDGTRKVDMCKMPEIYMSLDDKVKENRFTDFLLITELTSPSKIGSRFIAKKVNSTSNEEIFHYDIRYTKLKRFDKFSFFVSMSVPGEFDRTSKSDGLVIEPDLYGVYEFHSKIDKQSKNSKMFEPVLYDADKKEKDATHSESLFYIGNKWKLYNPKGGEIRIEDITVEN